MSREVKITSQNRWAPSNLCQNMIGSLGTWHEESPDEIYVVALCSGRIVRLRRMARRSWTRNLAQSARVRANGGDMSKTLRKSAATQSRPATWSEHTISRRSGAQYRHSWTERRGGGLDSTCMNCSTLVATNMDELSLLVVEQTHICRC